MTKKWVLKYYAGDMPKYGCGCCSNPTMRWRTKEFRFRWTARLARWWIANLPSVGIQVLVGGWMEPKVEEKRRAG